MRARRSSHIWAIYEEPTAADAPRDGGEPRPATLTVRRR